MSDPHRPRFPDGSALTIGQTSCEVHAGMVTCTQGNAVVKASLKSFTAQ